MQEKTDVREKGKKIFFMPPRGRAGGEARLRETCRFQG